MSIKSFVECFVSIKTAPDLSQFLIAETFLGEDTLVNVPFVVSMNIGGAITLVDEVHGDRVLIFFDTNRNAIHPVHDFELMTANSVAHSNLLWFRFKRSYILEITFIYTSLKISLGRGYGPLPSDNDQLMTKLLLRRSGTDGLPRPSLQTHQGCLPLEFRQVLHVVP